MHGNNYTIFFPDFQELRFNVHVPHDGRSSETPCNQIFGRETLGGSRRRTQDKGPPSQRPLACKGSPARPATSSEGAGSPPPFARTPKKDASRAARATLAGRAGGELGGHRQDITAGTVPASATTSHQAGIGWVKEGAQERGEGRESQENK